MAVVSMLDCGLSNMYRLKRAVRAIILFGNGVKIPFVKCRNFQVMKGYRKEVDGALFVHKPFVLCTFVSYLS